MSTGRKVSVLVVDDSAVCRQLIIEALKADAELEVVGEAETGEDAVRKVEQLKPQVITMDVEMPVMDGLSATEHIMSTIPTPILVLTGDPRKEAPALTHRALAVGALALKVKPALDAGPEAWNLAREVKLLSTVRVIRHLRGLKRAGVDPRAAPGYGPSAVGLITVVAGTGGPQVLQHAVTQLSPDFPVPVVVVQHINPSFAESMVSWLGTGAKVSVRVARDGDLLTPATVLVAPPDCHLTVPARGRVAVTKGAARNGFLPSGDLLLESAAQAYGRRAAGVVLTGMGTDGADGLAAIRSAGGVTLAQTHESAVVPAMPAQAQARGVDHLFPGPDLAQVLDRLVRGTL